MLPFTKKLNDNWFRFAGIPFVALMSNIIFYRESGRAAEKFSFWEVFLLSATETFILWEINRLAILYCRNRFPALGQSAKRISLQLILCTLITAMLRYLNVYIYDVTEFWGYHFNFESYLYNIYVGLLYSVIVGGIYEGIYYFRQWKASFIEAEALKKANLQTQLDLLREQMNPHFLFNSLSTLSSLISIDPDKAERFVEELSAVYRYLLQSQHDTLITVEKEIRFVEAYFLLLQTRFGKGIDLQVQVAPHHAGALLPPLTLQTLLENAVKHNMVRTDSPLVIAISSTATGLQVRNNLQRKNAHVLSTGNGLKNIRSKFNLLHHNNINIEESDGAFTVILPLIFSYEPSHH